MRSVGAGRDRMIRGTLLAALSLVAVATFGAPAASAACPNEAFRTGPSALLPECRAYEMVTPVDKESAVAVSENGTPSLISSSGDGIYYASNSAYAGAPGSTIGNPYLAGRNGTGWGVQEIGGAQAPQATPVFAILSGISDDLGLAMVVSKEALAPGAISGGSNLYVRDNRTGSYTTVAAQPGNEAIYDWAGFGYNPPFVGATPDWSTILVASRRALTPDAVAGQQNLFEYSEGRFRLAVPEAERATKSLAVPNVISTDGSRFYYNQVDPLTQPGPLYLHVRGQETSTLVSEDAEGNPFRARFIGATPDGEIAFFYREDGSVYRFEASAPAGERVTDLAPPGPGGESPEVRNAYAGEDGTTVYFAARALLTADAEPREGFSGTDLYVWHGAPGQKGGLRYIGKSEVNEVPAPTSVSVTPDGRFFGFESFGKVTPDVPESPPGGCPRFGGLPQGPCLNVFLYSLDEGRTVCVSCSSSPQTSSARLGDGSAVVNNGPASSEAVGPAPTPVLEDGSIFFETTSPLAARDGNGVTDVYRRRGDTTELISTGTDAYPSKFVGASASGSDVFFTTSQPLVGQDIDENEDIYDARIDGGLPQGAGTTEPSCVIGADCRPTGVASGPSPARPGTATVGDAQEGTAVACRPAAAKARAARKRSQALMRRSRHAKGKGAKSLRKKAAREARTAGRLGRRAGTCRGGGR